MRDYQRKKHTKYIVDRVVYQKTIWVIRDYYRLKDICSSLLEESPDPNFNKVKSTNKIIKQTENIVIKRDKYLIQINVIDNALRSIPEEYRKGIWNNILYNTPYPIYADRSTYGRWKSKFIYQVAKDLEIF